MASSDELERGIPHDGNSPISQVAKRGITSARRGLTNADGQDRLGRSGPSSNGKARKGISAVRGLVLARPYQDEGPFSKAAADGDAEPEERADGGVRPLDGSTNAGLGTAGQAGVSEAAYESRSETQQMKAERPSGNRGIITTKERPSCGQ